MSTSNLVVAIRGADPTDHNYVAATYLQSTWPTMRQIQRKTDFFRLQRLLFEQLIKTAAVVVATPADDPGFIVGWAIFSVETDVHFIYVRNRYRRMGVGRQLLAVLPPSKDGGVYATHLTTDGVALATACGVRPFFAPQLLALGDPK